MINMYIFAIIPSVDLSMKNIYKNSIILSIICPKKTIPAIILTIGFGVMSFLYLIFLSIYIFSFGIAFMVFINNFLIYPEIQKYSIKEI